MDVLTQINLPQLKYFSSGKVREIFDLDKFLLIVTTDRISAFDVILPDGIPYKGKILTNLSTFWFGFLKEIKHHFVTDKHEIIQRYNALLNGRSMIVKKAVPFPIECVVRGHILGSGWKDYQTTGCICGIKLPAGLKLAQRLPEPLFTPATKATTGHDENISFERVVSIGGMNVATKLRDLSISIYSRAYDYALSKGIIISDTKFEFGLCDGEITLIDEVLTPDSSRFWPLEGFKAGENPASFDKQFVRDYLEAIKWDKKPPAPNLPDHIISKTSQRYIEAYRMLTGKEII